MELQAASIGGREHAGYVEIPTRTGLQGAVDKLIAVHTAANHYATKAEVQQLALRVAKDAGSAADEQVLAVERFCRDLRYRREPLDILRDPLQVSQYGGDCDDMTLLCLALLRALSIPCQPQVFCDDHDLEAFHIRALAYLPPAAPPEQQWCYPIDPVYHSEPVWHLAEKGGVPTSLDRSKVLTPAQSATMPGTLQMAGASDEQPSRWSTWAKVAAVAFALGAAWYLGRTSATGQRGATRRRGAFDWMRN